jgi:hypothetical protein
VSRDASAQLIPTKPQSPESRAREAQQLQAQLEALDAAARELARPVESQQQQVFRLSVLGLVAAAIQPVFPLRKAPP